MVQLRLENGIVYLYVVWLSFIENDDTRLSEPEGGLFLDYNFWVIEVHSLDYSTINQ